MVSSWAERRETSRRRSTVAVTVWLGASVILAALDDTFLWFPVVAAAPVAVYVVSIWSLTCWWRRRSAPDGLPMVRAAVARSLAVRRPQPESWQELLVVGVLTVSETHWRWRPPVVTAADFRPLAWPRSEIAAIAWAPSHGPLLPKAAYVRLHPRSSAAVDLLVWEPDRLRAHLGTPPGTLQQS